MRHERATETCSQVITVFAPTNDAFAELLGRLKMTKDQLLDNKARVQACRVHASGAGF